MKIKVFPSKIEGVMHAPASKSSAQRLLLMTLSKKQIQIKGLGIDEDTQSMLGVLRALPLMMEEQEDFLNISSTWTPTRKDIGHWTSYLEVNVGESGFALRTLLFILPMFSAHVIIRKSGTLKNRNFDEIKPLLLSWGWEIHEDQHQIEIKSSFNIQSFMEVEDWPVLGSSQYLSGYLIALSLLLDWGVLQWEQHYLLVPELKSEPYVLQTLEHLEMTGHYYAHLQEGKLQFAPPKIRDNIWFVDRDWSSAAFIMAAAISTSSSITIKGLDLFKQQADKKILEALQDMGIQTSIRVDEIEIRKTEKKHAFQFDATHCPDLFPALFVMAVQCTGTSVIHGVHRLQNKESDRSKAIISMGTALGIKVFVQDDMMIIEGNSIGSAELSTYGDHRIAMALAILGMSSKEGIQLDEPAVINKSYPEFFQEMQARGMILEEIEVKSI